ncbi:KAP family P-loop NTPase fold protein [Amycolatopsis sp. NBC_01286]|uniref:KAP family P-loop NTPase fold protein n=1 Tax=Amycolatopsis sp. NBC_01286 TaxID=2903560 RepID=UPI002E0D8223|nr:P-loop NTPase fold protein [Amycolatopsis sp. NBC_01286]
MVATGDNPIKGSPDDALGRAPLARHLAVELRNLDVTEGSVFAIMGPWGSGKTSLVNLIRENLAKEPALTVVDFNPWMFSGAEQLVDSFFVEIAAQLGERPGKLKKIAEELDAYGELLSPLGAIPFVGSWVTRFGAGAKAIKKFEERRKQSVTQRRAKLAGQLSELEQPVIVVIDDLDRLDSGEIRDIFKLVRLTASFPNIIYLLAFDRHRVELALSGEGVTGRSYLEKIVQASAEVPAISDNLLVSQVADALNETLGDMGDSRFDETRWPDIMMEIVHPFVRNMRDVRRFAGSARGTFRSLEGDVDTVDVIALEAVRVFAPELFRSVVSGRVALTTPASMYIGTRPNEEHRATVEALLESSPGHEKVAEALIRRVFLAAGQYVQGGMNYGGDFRKSWLRDRRLAHPYVLGLYLERLVGDDLVAFNHAERAFAVLENPTELQNVLMEIDSARREDVIAELENFEGEYPMDAVVPASAVLLNILPDLPERQRAGLAAGSSRSTVKRVVLRLFRVLKEPSDVKVAVERVLAALTTFSAKLDLIQMVGHREYVGHELAREEDSQAFEDQLSAQLQSAVSPTLAADPGAFRLLLWMRKRPTEEQQAIDALFADPKLNRHILLQAYSEVRGQALDSRFVSRERRLGWDALLVVYGGEEKLRDAIESVRSNLAADDETAKAAVELALKYLTGWRPEEF